MTVWTIATMLQDPRVTGSDVARTSAAVAFLCALASLSCGAVLYLHLVRIKKTEHAVEWLAVRPPPSYNASPIPNGRPSTELQRTDRTKLAKTAGDAPRPSHPPALVRHSPRSRLAAR